MFIKYPRLERIDSHLIYKVYILIEGEKEWKIWPIYPYHFNVESRTVRVVEGARAIIYQGLLQPM
jgi:hypothetical protein